MQCPQVDPVAPWSEKYSLELCRLIIAEHEKLHHPVKEKNAEHLKRLIKKYPKIPQLYLVLYDTYALLERQDKSARVLDRMMELFPDYLFTRVLMARRYSNQGKVAQMPELLGEELSLQALYPQREAFTPPEVTNYYEQVYHYYYRMGFRKKAEDTIALLTYALNNYPHGLAIIHRLEEFRAIYGQELFDQADDNRIPAFTKIYQPPTKLKQKPEFENEAINQLYTTDRFMEEEMFQQILALPKDSLINDLEKVLQDSKDRFLYFNDLEREEETHSFPLHALLLLADLKAEKSLPVVLDFIRQGFDILFFWLRDVYNVVLGFTLYQLAQQQLQSLINFIKEKDVEANVKSSVIEVFSLIAQYQPERRKEMLAYLKEMLDFYYQHRFDVRLMDSEIIGAIANEMMTLKATELEQELKRFYEQEMVYDAKFESWTAYRNALHEGSAPQPASLFTTRQLYIILKALSEETDDFFDLDFDMEIDENEPCFCGSGKKYKNCCGRDQLAA